jgi:hypothetical protein
LTEAQLSRIRRCVRVVHHLLAVGREKCVFTSETFVCVLL